MLVLLLLDGTYVPLGPETLFKLCFPAGQHHIHGVDVSQGICLLFNGSCSIIGDLPKQALDLSNPLEILDSECLGLGPPILTTKQQPVRPISRDSRLTP